VGDTEGNESGITIYDRTTGLPVCVYIEDGVMQSTNGPCVTTGGGTGTSTPPAGGETGATTDDGADTEPPQIIINGANPAHLTVGDTYSDMGAIVSDNVDENLGYTATGIEDVDTTATGTYFVHYDAADSAGNTAERKTRAVIVEPYGSAPGQTPPSAGQSPPESAGSTSSPQTGTTTPGTSNDDTIAANDDGQSGTSTAQTVREEGEVLTHGGVGSTGSPQTTPPLNTLSYDDAGGSQTASVDDENAPSA